MYLNIIGKRISVIMIKVFLLGDSIVTAYGKDSENFIGGWGDHLGSFFDDKFVSVISCAEGGESSGSFLNDGRFIDNGLFTKEMFPQGVGPCYELIREGDFVFIQFSKIICILSLCFCFVFIFISYFFIAPIVSKH